MTAINIYSKYATDLNKEKNGSKYYIDQEADCYILVARYSPRLQSKMVKESADLVAKYGKDADSLDAVNESNKIFIKHCILGWNNIADKDGNELQFSTDTAVEFLPQMPDLVDELLSFALKADNYRYDETVKN